MNNGLIYFTKVIKSDNKDGRLRILFADIFINKEEALNISKRIIKDYIKTNKKSKKLKTEQFEIWIEVVSSLKKTFNSKKEQIDYYESNINNISNNDLYSFLLTLVDRARIVYDYQGNKKYEVVEDYWINSVYDLDKNNETLNSSEFHDFVLEFTEDGCKNGEYYCKYI